MYRRSRHDSSRHFSALFCSITTTVLRRKMAPRHSDFESNAPEVRENTLPEVNGSGLETPNNHGRMEQQSIILRHTSEAVLVWRKKGGSYTTSRTKDMRSQSNDVLAVTRIGRCNSYRSWRRRRYWRHDGSTGQQKASRRPLDHRATSIIGNSQSSSNTYWVKWCAHRHGNCSCQSKIRLSAKRERKLHRKLRSEIYTALWKQFRYQLSSPKLLRSCTIQF